MAASLQALTGGTFVLGDGAGGKKDAYLAYGDDVPRAATRIAMIEEGLEVIHARWRNEAATFHGQFSHRDHARCAPRPASLPPIMIGGDGEQRTRRAVARYADWLRVCVER